MPVDVLIFTDMARLPYVKAAGAYRIATELRAHGFAVQVVDHFTFLAHGGLKRLRRVIDRFVGANTLFVGFSTTFFLREHEAQPLATHPLIPLVEDDARELVSWIRQRNPRTRIVAGGTKAVPAAGSPLVDTFIPGYADSAVVEYARYLRGDNPFFQFTPLPGGGMLVDKDQKAVRFNFRASTIGWEPEDLVSPGEILPIEIARGCIFRCKFCSFPLNGKRNDLAFVKERDTLYRELVANYERYGTTSYIFADDTFNDSVEKLELLAELFARLPFRLRYTAYVRHDLIWKHREMADLLLESGLVSANFGLETLHHDAGKAIGKGLHPDKTRELLAWLRDEKWRDQVITHSGFIIGLPHETPQTVEAWANEVLDPAFPLDGFRFNALRISGAARFHRSEFELNHEAHGYRFTDPRNPSWWENDAFTFASALEQSWEITRKADRVRRNRIAGFNPFMFQNLGYNWDDIKTMSTIDTPTADLLDRRMRMVSGYFDLLMRTN